MSNFTWDVRNCVVPSKGRILVSIDYSGLELAATAHQLQQFYGHSAMKDIINSGNKPIDMHSNFATEVMKLTNPSMTYEEFVARKKEPEFKAIRQLVKPPHLGIPGGIGHEKRRGIMAKEGLNLPPLLVLATHKYESPLYHAMRKYQGEYRYLRIQRIGKYEYQLVYDELMRISNVMFNMYPELKLFLREGHNKFLTGKKVKQKNEWGEWEEQPMYKYDIYGFRRDFCTYTAFCNGYLMQTPAAIGAKRACCEFISKYLDTPHVKFLAFIHDEILFEVDKDYEWESVIEDCANIMIDSMHSILSTVRLTVEASAMDYWAKSGGFWEKVFWKDANSLILKS
jgi:hypothetical protein